MLLADSDLFITLAVNAVAPINGMYVLYTSGASDTIPVISSAGSNNMTITTGGVVTSGGSLDAFKNHVITVGDSLGLARVSNAFPAMPVSGATTTFYATTANAEQICGLPLTPGKYARAVLLAHIDEHRPESDTALDYNELANATVFPANGAITLIDEVTAE